MNRAFSGSLLFTAAAFVLAAVYGWETTHSLPATLDILWIVAVLAVLEVSLSFDNAVVNATVLRDMDPVWRRRFLIWGMPIAVFGMRIVFPLAIVALAAGVGPAEALHLSLHDPARYAAILTGAHVAIAGFGGSFLLLVGLEDFIDASKDVHGLGPIERRLAALGPISASAIALVLTVLLGIAHTLPHEAAATFIRAGIIGILVHVGVAAIGTIIESREAARAAAGAVVRSGLGGFIMLEVLDASFSLDGVIGAFALSNAMVVIAIGLTVGAVFVRSITLLLVARGTLGEWRYLEHGAFWAIVALGVIMLASVQIEVPEAVTGLVGAILIGLALFASRRRA